MSEHDNGAGQINSAKIVWWIMAILVMIVAGTVGSWATGVQAEMAKQRDERAGLSERLTRVETKLEMIEANQKITQQLIEKVGGQIGDLQETIHEDRVTQTRREEPPQSSREDRRIEPDKLWRQRR